MTCCTCVCMYVGVCSRRGVGPGSPCMGHEARHKRIERITWRTSSAAMCSRFCPFASLPGSARHEGVSIKPAKGAAATTTRKEVSALWNRVGRKGKGQSLFLRALKLAKWSTCGAEPSLKKTNIIKGPSRLPESTLGLLGGLSLPI